MYFWLVNTNQKRKVKVTYNNFVTKRLKTYVCDWGDSLAVKSIDCSSKGLWFNF